MNCFLKKQIRCPILFIPAYCLAHPGITPPVPDSRPAIEISSSSSSQCSPFGLISNFRRCSGAACIKRGNHANGTARMRPSDNSTHILLSSNRTDLAEVLIPFPFDWINILFDCFRKLAQRARINNSAEFDPWCTGVLGTFNYSS